ncbi:MAG: transporter, family [Solirubrobacteraceae bacterium]|nr:transporter, family [Solirubrobacteraceae bacterium]
MDDDRRWRLLSLPVIGWILYDFANTIFSFVVVTRYYNDWIIEERGQPDIYVGLMVAAVSVTLVVTLPLLGALADGIGHKRILIAFTLLSVVATGLLGVVDSILLALIVAGIATFAFNTADSQYHPLLSVVAPEPRRGRVSGIGVAVGYLGSLTALFAIGSFVADGEAQQAFLPAAALFLLFALPLFVLVKEPPRPQPEPGEWAPARPFAQLAATLRRARGAPHGRLLLARFFYVDAIATVLAFLTVYARRTGDFDGDSIDALLAVSAVIAIVGALGGGLLAERIGPKRVIIGTLWVAIVALIAAAVTGSGELLWVVGPLIGIVLGSLSAVDRVFLLRLVPPERRGEDFALYALVGKLSSGLGPLVLWGGTILVAERVAGLSKFDASRLAVLVLAAAAVLGLLILRPLSDDALHDAGESDPVV